MSKFYGLIGFSYTEETKPGVWEEVSVERNYYGELTRSSRLTQPSQGINDDFNIANELSIISDAYANEHIFAIKYAKFMGAKWKINKVEVQFPRLILSIGGVYND